MTLNKIPVAKKNFSRGEWPYLVQERKIRALCC